MNPSVYNIIHWLAGPMGQTTCRPNIWCSKHYFFFHNTHSIYFFIFFIKLQMKIKSFECPKSISNYERNTRNVRRLVKEIFVPSAKGTSVLYCRLSDFMSLNYWQTTNIKKDFVPVVSYLYFKSALYITWWFLGGNSDIVKNINMPSPIHKWWEKLLMLYCGWL
jgi:hypothetical protein